MLNDEDLNDRALILRIKNHEDSAIAELYTRMKPIVLKSLLGMGASHEEAEDAVVDSILQFCKHILHSRFDFDHIPITNYLCIIARNRLMDELRKRRITQSVSSDLFDKIELSSLRIGDKIKYEEKIDFLETALNKLSASDGELIRQHYFEKKSYQEIAKEKDISVHAIVIKISRSMSKLRGIVSQLKSDL
ncbi:MAG: hypothetical protein RL329_452 [Bacteroidota bacterium]|jgi:RNA polymerase sigma-70 factor (ECF subfamily)